MKHLINTIVVIELLLDSLIINGRTICPTGKPVTKETCELGDSCPDHSLCYRHNGERFCCGDLDKFCPTKMFTFYREDGDNSYLLGNTKIEKGEPEWYNVTLGNDTIGCRFDATKPERTDFKTCEINSDCDINNEEFCDQTFNRSFDRHYFLDYSGPNRTTTKFCYKFQNYGTVSVKPIIKPDEMSLRVCNNNSDCFESHGSETFCFEIKNPIERGIIQVIKQDESKFYKGVCAIANICDRKKHESNVSSLSKNNDYCITDEDCQGNSISKKYPHLEPECVAIKNLTYDGNMCCFKHNTVCEVGEIIFPLKKCSRFEDCNGNGTLTNQWCAEKGNHCCRDDGTRLWACPDGVTPLFNEPKCEEYISWDINSGTCPQEAGICRYGHCCPPSRLNNANETVMGQKPYITNVACNPEESVPPQFKHAFCHPEKKKIVIMGEKDVNGDATVNEGTACKSNKNCKEGHFCVSGINGEHHCFLNPLILKKQESADSQLWTYVIIGAIVCAVLFLIASIIFFICRLKSKKMPSKATTPKLTTKTG